MALRNWFLPHKDTHKKAHLISPQAILIYILLFILMQVSFSIISYVKPGVLGISANIDVEKIIELTNIERQKKGLPPVKENEALDKAASLKAANMFTENYWAHFAPSGKTPWDFILGSGYKFTYAGENLAKNFYNADDVVAAWMASPTHRDNLLNNKYDDIGISVSEGILNGQKTILIVQEFGTTKTAFAPPAVNVAGNNVGINKEEYNSKPTLAVAVSGANPVPKQAIDPYQISKIASYSVIGLISFLLMVDMLVLYRRGVLRLSSHHIAHMSLLSIAAATIFTSSPGSIL